MIEYLLMKFYVILFMIFLHIVDDYYLQGILASMKQKVWWEKNAPEKLYKFDYIWGLIMHSFSWAFVVMSPVTLLNAVLNNSDVSVAFFVVFFLNVIVHAITDHLKANVKVINLWVDQLIHVGQIIITALVLF